jgi:hypothetical protein
MKMHMLVSKEKERNNYKNKLFIIYLFTIIIIFIF